jgi:hypothetical protein
LKHQKSVLQAIQTGSTGGNLDNEDEADDEPLGSGMDEGEPVA